MHKIAIQIRFSDIDRLNHVTNSVYNQYLDVARCDYLLKSLGNLIDWDNHTLVLVHVENDFLQPTRLYDKIFVESQITHIGNRSVQMQQQIVDENGNVKVKSKCIFSTLEPKTNTSFVLPQEWREAIEKYEKNK